MELEPIYSNQKSFYGKARILRENGVIKLLSYSTIVATIENGKLHINGFYSKTTLRAYKGVCKTIWLSNWDKITVTKIILLEVEGLSPYFY